MINDVHGLYTLSCPQSDLCWLFFRYTIIHIIDYALPKHDVIVLSRSPKSSGFEGQKKQDRIGGSFGSAN